MLLFVIIATSLIMTWAMIKDKRKMGTLLDEIDEEVLARNEAEDTLREKNNPEKPEEGIDEGLEEIEEPRTQNLSNDTDRDGANLDDELPEQNP